MVRSPTAQPSLVAARPRPAHRRNVEGTDEDDESGVRGARHGAGAINLAGFGARVNGMHLAMVLRATADELEGTEAWKKALAVARTSLERAGIDPNVALYGLNQPE
jgi:hypothetical protein